MGALTRANLRDAVHEEVGLSHREAEQFVDVVIETICERLVAGETVKISGFGTFVPRGKGPRMGRNPKTGEPARISARRVAVFRPSRILQTGVSERLSGSSGEDS